MSWCRQRAGAHVLTVPPTRCSPDECCALGEHIVSAPGVSGGEPTFKDARSVTLPR